MTRTGIVAIVVGGLIVALGLAFFVSPLASSSPDGLEKVATNEGFIETAEDHDLADSPLAGYGVEGVGDESLGTGLSGIIGVAITGGIALVLFGIVHARRPRSEDDHDARSPATAG
ncbi:MAG TPA: PDGLE domain-containing protein [Actinomycetota bacterium]|nr:PDGLE domain-containing protein [Actinomycetota bacterium]